MAEERRHPDIFSPEEAAAYLHLETASTLDWLKAQGWLTHYTVGKQRVFYKRDLDDCALRIVGEVPQQRPQLKPLRMASQ